MPDRDFHGAAKRARRREKRKRRDKKGPCPLPKRRGLRLVLLRKSINLLSKGAENIQPVHSLASVLAQVEFSSQFKGPVTDYPPPLTKSAMEPDPLCF